MPSGSRSAAERILRETDHLQNTRLSLVLDESSEDIDSKPLNDPLLLLLSLLLPPYSSNEIDLPLPSLHARRRMIFARDGPGLKTDLDGQWYLSRLADSSPGTKWRTQFSLSAVQCLLIHES